MQQGGEYVLPGNERLHYIKMGTGKRLLLAFHGYNNNASLFTSFGAELGGEFTIISFDLPYHGGSKWLGRPFVIGDLGILLQAVMRDHGVDKVYLMGYSLGGRVCLTIAEHWPQWIDRVVLLSSDGLAFNPVYYFATSTGVGRRMFHQLVKKPDVYIKAFNLMRKYNVIHESLFQFVKMHLQPRQNREFLKKVWLVMKEIKPHLKHLKKVLNGYKIPVFVFAGAYDRIIPLKQARSFVKGLRTARLIILQSGHRTINVDTIPEIAKILAD